MYEIPIEQAARVLIQEAFLRRKLVVAVFVIVSVSIISVGLVWPKSFSSYTTILVEQRNIIQPLMEGAAVATQVTDRARIVKEIVYSRNLLTKMLAETDQLEEDLTDIEVERLLEALKGKIKVDNVGRDMIRIIYSDSDAKTSFVSVEKVAELFIAESFEAQSRESQQAFQFIDKQVADYHAKLIAAEEGLKDFRSRNLDARPGTAAEVGARINTIQARIEAASQELNETLIQQASIEKQLSGEAEITGSMSREGQFRTRILELQQELDTLRLDYREGYPDIVRLKHQIQDLNQSIINEKKLRDSGKLKNKAENDRIARLNVFLNPLYQNLRQDLSNAKTLIETLRARLKENKRLMVEEIKRGKRVHTGEAKMAELTRDYEVNRDIYRDLLRRRERARVSMNMDLAQQGLSMKVYEPAFLPLSPSGPRFIHFIAGGILLGVGSPFLLLFAMFRLDPRVRVESIISEKMGLTVLGAVPHLATRKEEQVVSHDVKRLSMIVAGTIVLIGIAGLLKMQGVL